jgi:hypothetical protein
MMRTERLATACAPKKPQAITARQKATALGASPGAGKMPAGKRAPRIPHNVTAAMMYK